MYFIYIAIIFFSGQMNPVSFAKKIGGVQLLAFPTSSRAAVITLSIETAHKRVNVRESRSELVIPLCTKMTIAVSSDFSLTHHGESLTVCLRNKSNPERNR